MEGIDLNLLLNRNAEVDKIKSLLNEFESKKNDQTIKRGIFIYGDSGCGKTFFVNNILKSLDYDIIKYDAGDIRNKSIIDTITKHNMSDKNILSMYYKKVKRIVIIMDEIDGMNNGDKGGINSLIKIVRPKKTKKQRQEETTLNPIICIGNFHVDKKIKELMKVCHVIELKKPTLLQITSILQKLITKFNVFDKDTQTNIINYIQGDLRRIKIIYDLYNTNNDIFLNNSLNNIFLQKSYNDDTRNITKKLINNKYTIDQHLTLMNETDRTIVGLLWHENIIDVLGKLPKEKMVQLYSGLLNNMCFSDYIDRITFQKQIWQFNEMSSLLKTFKNNKVYHDNIPNKFKKFNPLEIRFTKVLTKYSTEYNNSIFIQNLCQELLMDKNDMFSFFLKIKDNYDEGEIINLFENYNITKLDINRIYRYLEKYTIDTDINNELNNYED